MSVAVALWKRYRLLVGWGATLGIFLIGIGYTLTHTIAGRSDFAIYLTAANALRHDPHATIYAIATLAKTHTTYGGCAPIPGWGYLYQPLLALVLESLTLLPCDAAVKLWLLLNIVVLLACVAWLVRRMRQRHGAGAALATAALCALALPIYEGLYYGQTHLLILGVCLGAVSFMRRGHPRWSGALLALGAFLKYLPALLLLYYLARRQWGVAIGAALAAAALGLLELIIVGPALLRASIFGGSGDLFATMSHSLSASFPYEPYVVCFLALGVFGAVCLMLFSWRKTEEPSAVGMNVGEAWAIGAMAFASPVLWNHYFTWLLPVAVVLLDHAIARRAGRSRGVFLSALVILCAFAFVNAATPPQMFAGLGLWLLCTGVLLAQLGVPLQFARSSPERVAVSQTNR